MEVKEDIVSLKNLHRKLVEEYRVVDVGLEPGRANIIAQILAQVHNVIVYLELLGDGRV